MCDTIRPGDDILLRFGLLNDTSDEPVIGEVSTGDFLAVYDKKMLWRANLYIDESEWKVDWNNAHPWDSTDNDWNKTYDGITWGSSQADGGQVVDLKAYNPVRSKDKSNWTNNVYNDRVAYDYPVGNALALDSPFDFIYKLQIQKENLKSFYTLNPESVLPYPLQWVTSDILQDWGSTAAPNNRWQNYTRTPSGGNAAYLPGLGLYQHSPAHASLETDLPAIFSAATYDQSLSAGVDCLGFAQRAAGYDGNKYQWNDFPADLAENGSIPGSNAASKREFHNLVTGKTDVIVSRQKIRNVATDKLYFTAEYGSEEGPFEEDFREYQKWFVLIRPGDIIRYDESHIGIVDSVDLEKIMNATTIADMMEGIGTIEAVYGSAVNFVIKRNMMEGLSGTAAVINANGSWYEGWPREDEYVPLRNWSIERLKEN